MQNNLFVPVSIGAGLTVFVMTFAILSKPSEKSQSVVIPEVATVQATTLTPPPVAERPATNEPKQKRYSLVEVSRPRPAIDQYTLSKIRNIRSKHKYIGDHAGDLGVAMAIDPIKLSEMKQVMEIIIYVREAHRLIDELGLENVASELSGIDRDYLHHEDYEKHRTTFEFLDKQFKENLAARLEQRKQEQARAKLDRIIAREEFLRENAREIAKSNERIKQYQREIRELDQEMEDLNTYGVGVERNPFFEKD